MEPYTSNSKIPEQHDWNSRCQETTENSHIEHCTRTSASTNVRVRNIQDGK